MKTRRLLFTVTIKDCKVETFGAGGPGGQHQNKTRSAVRITHPPSGAVGECREFRSQHQNKKEAWQRMGDSKKFRTWARIEAARVQGQKTTEELVEEAMVPENLKLEVRGEDEKWKVVTNPNELRGEEK